VGLIEEADGGTLFLDEIGEMAPALQAKLLHVLESGTVRAVGSNKERSVNTRILAATHRNLRDRAKAGTFREDLLYRLDVVTIALPPLRLRQDDLPVLIEHFFKQAKSKHPHSPVERFAPEAITRLLAHRWPGNVRELEHVVERAVLLGRASTIAERELPTSVTVSHASNGISFAGEIVPMREVQRRYAAWVYEQLGGRKLQTADRLGIDHKTLTKWLVGEGDSEREG
jgi:two-component system response regulator HydG